MLPYVSDVHGYLPNPKVSQDFEFVALDQGKNHDLYQNISFIPLVARGAYIPLYGFCILCIFIIEHYSITDFAVLVYSYFNFADVMSINLYLIPLIY